MEERNEKQYIPETLAKINRRELLHTVISMGMEILED